MRATMAAIRSGQPSSNCSNPITYFLIDASGPSDSPGKVKIVSNASHTIDLEDSKHFTIEEAKRIGEALGVDWSKFDVEQFRMGLDVELEHGLRDLQTNVTHDNEMEKEAKEFHNKK
jgi:hypothetical protein